MHRMEGQAFVNSRHSSPPPLAIGSVAFRWLYPARSVNPLFLLPEHGFGLESVHQKVGGLESGAAMGGRGSDEDDAFARLDRATTMDHQHIINLEPRRAVPRDLVE